MNEEIGELVDEDVLSEAENDFSSSNEKDTGDDTGGEREVLDLTQHSPFFETSDANISSDLLFCSTCGNRINNNLLMVDGECISCAKKRLRRLETKLVNLKATKPQRFYCLMDGHSEVVPDKFHPNWDKITVFGVDFYVPGKLCPNCINMLRAYFIRYLEDRGILRCAQGHHDSEWLKAPHKLSLKESIDATRKFTEFMYAVDVYTKDSESGMSSLLQDTRDTFKRIMKKEVNKQCQEKLNLRDLQKQNYPILNLIQEKSAVEKLSEETKSRLLLKEGVPKEVHQDVVNLLTTNLKQALLIYPKSVGEEPDMNQLKSLTLTSLLANHPTLVEALSAKAEYCLGPHASYATDVLTDAVKQFRTLVSTLQLEQE